jgi:diguanylate cyclase (GGDEF)-like protein/PAS domain S-box-containing protein
MATILIVDGDSQNRCFLTTLLGYRGHRTSEATNAGEALAAVRTGRPDLILSDLVMPTMDGFEFLRRLRSEELIAQTPVIFYAAVYAWRGVRILVENAGVVRFLTKPADPEEILRTVDETLAAADTDCSAVDTELDREHLRVLTDKLARQVAALKWEVAERERVEKTLRQSLEQLQTLTRHTAEPKCVNDFECRCLLTKPSFESAIEGIITLDGEGRVVSFNPAAAALFGFPAEELIGRKASQLMAGVAWEDLPHATEAARSIEGRELLGRRKDGNTLPLDLVLSEMVIGGRRMYTVIVRDMTERKRTDARLARSAAELAELASTDALTGLRNARHLRDAMLETFSAAAHVGRPQSVVLVDVDRFESYNAAFGNRAGDEVLRRLGTILKRLTRATDLAARYGGGEFALLLPSTDAEGARALVERVRTAVARVSWSLRPVTVGFGLATHRVGPVDAELLLAQADAALYRAKSAGPDHVVHHDDSALEGWDSSTSDTVDEPSSDRALASIGVPTVLHIEEDLDYRSRFGQVLALAGLKVVAAATASEGLRLAAEGIDLIVLGAGLRAPQGLDLCRRLRADPATAATPVLSFSSPRGCESDRRRRLTPGADATLAESAGPEELLNVIARLLRIGGEVAPTLPPRRDRTV